jgi:hypothetical protein
VIQVQVNETDSEDSAPEILILSDLLGFRSFRAILVLLRKITVKTSAVRERVNLRTEIVSTV